MIETGESAIDDPALASRYVGAVDQLVQARLSGWAVNMLGDPCQVTVRLNGEPVATVASGQPRPDLHAKQQSRGLGGWHCDLGALLKPGENRIEALAPDGSHLLGSPFLNDGSAMKAPASAIGPKTYMGAIDTPGGKLIAGWAIGPDGKAAAVLVRINDRPPMTIEADLDRPDLIAQHLTDAGGGWRFDAELLMVPGRNRISITFPDGQHLPGSPIERVIGEATAGPPPSPTVAPPPPSSAPATAPFGRGLSAKAPARPSVALATAPAPAVSAAAAPATAPTVNITPFPARNGGRPGMPSLAELDELSLDDLSLAVAKGIITVPPPPVAEPVSAPETPVETHHARRSGTRGRGFFARLFQRR